MADAIVLRVLTCNVWNLDGEPDRQYRLREGILALRPDVVALQEVVRTPAEDQLAMLFSGTGFHLAHQFESPETTPADSIHGVALASRWRPTRVDALALPQGAHEGGIRSALAATIALPNGLDILVMVVKPSWELDGEAMRVQQAQAIAEFEAKLRAGAPSIIAGDFDATPDADSLRYLTGRAVVDGTSVYYSDAWAVAGDGGPGHTWTAGNPLAAPLVDLLIGQPSHARRIDYILVGSRLNHRGTVSRVRSCHVVLTDPPVSDHFGVLAEIAVEP